MKAVYKIAAMCWFVEGLGLFQTQEEAKKAIDENKLKHTVNIRISDKTKHQLTTLAIEKNTTMSEVIRQLVEKEVKDYGEKENN